MFDLTGITFVKKAGVASPLTDSWVPGDEDDKETQEIVRRMLKEIKEGGEEVARGYAEKLDNYKGSILLTEAEIAAQIQEIPQADRDAIDFIVSQVTNFATQTRDRNADWEVDLGNGSKAGTKYV